jgi:RNA polymerase sigma-70 factor (ECF subfamily)
MDDMRTDEALMLAYRDGAAAAFEVLYARHRARLYRYLAHQVPEAADELFQDVWLRVIRARAGYEVSAKFTTWLYRIAHNRLMDHFRARARHHERSYDHDDALAMEVNSVAAAGFDDPPSTLERKRAVGRIVAAVESLPAAQREAFLLAEEADMSVDDIAAATGVGRETAKSRLRYALAKLRDLLAEHA